MAMPWSRAKTKAAEYRDGTRDVADLTRLFDACFRIQREACEAAGRHIPMVVENVKGAQPWVGRAKWHYGSFYLWGDVPTLMPIVTPGVMKLGVAHRSNGETNFHGSAARAVKVPGLNWSGSDKPGYKAVAFNDTAVRRLQSAAVKQSVAGTGETYGGDFGWDGSAMRTGNSKSPARKAASAQIAMIPFELSRWIARTYKPVECVT